MISYQIVSPLLLSFSNCGQLPQATNRYGATPWASTKITPYSIITRSTFYDGFVLSIAVGDNSGEDDDTDKSRGRLCDHGALNRWRGEARRGGRYCSGSAIVLLVVLVLIVIILNQTRAIFYTLLVVEYRLLKLVESGSF
jgi:hypothetical protein